MLRPVAALAAAAALLTASVAEASSRIPRDEGFMRKPASVQNRLYSLDGTHDFAAFFAFSIQNQLTEHYGATLVWDYSFTEYVALDVMLGGGLGQLTSLAKDVRGTARATGRGADLEDAGALLGHGSLGVRFTSAYGKLSLSSELPVHFHAYAVAGVGAAFVNYHGVLSCASDRPSSTGGGSSACPNGEFRSETGISPAFNVGGGFRFIINERFSVRLEIRDVIFFDRWYDQVEFATPASNPGELKSGFTHVPLVMFGAGVTL